MVAAAVLSVVVMLAAAIAVVRARNFLSAVAALSVVSLALSVLFALLKAPDVAMAEAAVGAGLSGVLLALAGYRLKLIGAPAAAHRAPANSAAALWTGVQPQPQQRGGGRFASLLFLAGLALIAFILALVVRRELKKNLH